MADLKVEIRESITLDGTNYNSYNFQVVQDINDVTRRRVTVPTSEQEIIALDTSVGSGTYIEQDVRYIRITNLSKEFPVMLTFKNDDADEFLIKVDKRGSFIYTGETDYKTTAGTTLSGSGVQNSFDAKNDIIQNPDTMGDLVNITAFTSASTAEIVSGSAGSGSGVPKAVLELFVASIGSR